MAAHQKKASRLKAHIVFLDESGFLTAPLVRRTWAPRGQTPVLLQCGRHREKASVIAVLSVSPARQKVGLYFSLASNLNVDGSWMVHFLRDLLRHLRGPVLLVWDRLNVHKSAAVARLRRRCYRLHVEWLPPYAPELNPVELVWSHLKRNPLANFAPGNANDLATMACRHARRLQRRQDLLRSFIRHGRLSLRL
jgi:transposase